MFYYHISVKRMQYRGNVRYSRKRAEDEIEMNCPMRQETVHLKKTQNIEVVKGGWLVVCGG